MRTSESIFLVSNKKTGGGACNVIQKTMHGVRGGFIFRRK